jgi:cell wall-associated NlpC family hydrolase
MWAHKYAGVPFADKGRGLDGMDCWGLVQHVYRGERGIELPGYEWCYHTTSDSMERIGETVLQQSSAHWKRIERGQEKEYDVVIMRMQGLPMHVGIVTQPGYMLHCLRGVGVSHENMSSARWRNRILGIVRHGTD